MPHLRRQHPVPIFCKKNNKSPILWYYYGLYDPTPSEDLDIEEYLALNIEVSLTKP